MRFLRNFGILPLKVDAKDRYVREGGREFKSSVNSESKLRERRDCGSDSRG